MKSAIIMAAGKGTRMKSDVPKVLHPILNQPMIEHVIDQLKKAGVQRIVSVVGFQYQMVMDAMQDACEYAIQQPQLGTGHAVMQAKQLENEDGITIVASGDGPCVTSELFASLFEQIQDNDMAVVTTRLEDAGHYGRIVRDEHGFVKKIVEFKDANDQEKKIHEINTGLYAFKTQSLFMALKQVTNDNAQHEYYLTDVLDILIQMGKRVLAIECPDPRIVQGINNNEEIVQANRYMQERINQYWLQQGVTIVEPNSTYIGPKVQIGKDVIIHPNTYIYGQCTIGNRVVIYPGTYIENHDVQDDQHVGPNVVFGVDL